MRNLSLSLSPVAFACVLAFAQLSAPAATLPKLHNALDSSTRIDSASGDSGTPVFSGDSHFLLFQSNAKNLQPKTSNPLTLRLYRYDLITQQLGVVEDSVANSSGTIDITGFAASANGQQFALSTVIFPAKATLKTSADSDVHRVDLATGANDFVSLSTLGTAGGNSPALHPVISDNGRWVAFESQSTNIVPVIRETKDFASFRDFDRSIFLRDTASRQTQLVNPLITNGVVAGDAYAAALSADGSRMSFFSRDTRTHPTSTRLYVRDNVSQLMLWTSPEYLILDTIASESLFPLISAEGRWITFAVQESTSEATIRVHDMITDQDYTRITPALRQIGSSMGSPQGAVWFETATELGIWDPLTDTIRTFPLSNASTRDRFSPSAMIAMSSTLDRAIYVSDIAVGDGSISPSPQVFLLDTTSGKSELISKSLAGLPGNQASILNVALSPDGKWAAFSASDSDLVEADANQAFDVFLYNIENHQLSLVSKHAPDIGNTRVGSLITGPASISADNRILVFSASDGNLVPNDTNGVVDVFAKDLKNGTVVNLSRNIPTLPGQNFLYPRVTEDGRHAAFLALRGSPFQNSLLSLRLFTVHIETGETHEVEAFAAGTVPLASDSSRPSSYALSRFDFSADGRWMVYTVEDFAGSRASIGLLNLDTGVSDSLITLSSSSIRRLSGSDALAGSEGLSPRISADGSKIWFMSTERSGPLSVRGFTLVEMDVATQKITPVAARDLTSTVIDTGFAISPDHTIIGYLSTPQPRNLTLVNRVTKATNTFRRYSDLFGFSAHGRHAVGWKDDGALVRVDTATGEEILIPPPYSNPGGYVGNRATGNLKVGNPILSADGRYVVFHYSPDPLTTNDQNRVSDVYVWDVVGKTTLLISSTPDGSRSGNRGSSAPILAPDGKTVVFRSWATDLTTASGGNAPDYYLMTLPVEDSDDDGLPDDWEMAYFNTLSRDGSGDFDGDGISDAQEFQIGTDPTNQGSVLRVISLQQAGKNQFNIFWAAVPGRSYAVQAQIAIDHGGWATLTTVKATSPTGSWHFSDPGTYPHRFYRVQIQP